MRGVTYHLDQHNGVRVAGDMWHNGRRQRAWEAVAVCTGREG